MSSSWRISDSRSARAIVEHAHVGVRLLEPVAPQPDVLDARDDPAEQQRLESGVVLRMVGDLADLVGVQAEVLPDLIAAQPVPHQVAALDDEVLALAQFRLGQLLVVVTQRHPAERDVPGLVLHHVGEDLLGQRLARHVAQQAEGGQREALDQHLHAEVGHVPAGVAQRVVQQRLQVGVDRVEQPDLLLQEPGVDLGVPGLVHGLGGGVELGVEVGHGLDDPGRADHRALLAVQELGELPGGRVQAQFPDVVRPEPVPERGAVDREGLVRHAEHVVRVDLKVPVDPLDRVPLLVLALLVEREQPVPAVVVLPGEAGCPGHRHPPAGLGGCCGVQVMGGHPASGVRRTYACDSSTYGVRMSMPGRPRGQRPGRPPGQCRMAGRRSVTERTSRSRPNSKSAS